ncbi:MAG: 30S ribosomal protein S6 [Opitutales bacterium]
MSLTTTKYYRASFILDTRGLETSAEDLIEEFAGISSSLGAEVTKKENMGVMPFVRVTDKKFPEGTFFQLELKAEPTFPAAIKDKLHLDRRVNRILINSL